MSKKFNPWQSGASGVPAAVALGRVFQAKNGDAATFMVNRLSLCRGRVNDIMPELHLSRNTSV
ncbi:MAG: hypothetical protein OXE76_08985, partial [Alphaproteobacteria bacterium]|nr:hypothetical protein [Alphaproteobacteria bacterium]